LLAWVEPLGTEADLGGGGLGKLLVQRLVEAGEHVVDVPPTLAARVRLVGSTKASKNDSNDALATAIAGWRHCGLRAVRVGDHTAVLGMLIDRYDDLVALRTQAASSPSRPTGSTCSRSVLVIVGRPDPSLTCP
jgi:transposase